jgi:hypothetical protein
MGFEEGLPIGIFPLFLQKKSLVKLLFSPPPHTAIPYMGFAVKFNEEAKNHDKESMFIDFCSKIIELISSKIKPGYTRFAFPPGVYDLRPFMWAGYEVKPYYCYYMDISNKNSDEILSRFKKNLRNDISRAAKSGVVIREGGEKELDTLYGFMQRRYGEQDKIVTVDKRYLTEIYSKFKKNIKIWVAEYNGEMLTGMIDLQYKGELASWIGNPKPGLTHVHANDLLNWTALKWACDNHLSRHVTIGAAGVQRLYKYSSKFNFEPLLCLTATKYSSPIFKIIERAYTDVIKPARAKL